MIGPRTALRKAATVKKCEVLPGPAAYTRPMRRVIREIITLIRIERWLVAGDDERACCPEGGAERITDQLVLSAAEAAQVRELFRHIIERRRWEMICGDDQEQA